MIMCKVGFHTRAFRDRWKNKYLGLREGCREVNLPCHLIRNNHFIRCFLGADPPQHTLEGENEGEGHDDE